MSGVIEKRRDAFKIVAVAMLGLGLVAAVGCVACVLDYLALERGPNDGFLTLFALDAAHDRAVASGVIAAFLLVPGGVLFVVTRHGKGSAKRAV